MRIHKSVMLNETINNLLFKKDGVFVDCTLGSGGHSLNLLDNLINGSLICIDSDTTSINDFRIRLKEKGFIETKDNLFESESKKVYLVNDNFSNIDTILRNLNLSNIDGIFADLGWSSDQLSAIEGLSFENEDENLDMRLDSSLGVKASDLLNVFSSKQLSKMFKQYADIYGKDNSFLVERIVDTRNIKPFEKVRDLLPILNKTYRGPNLKSFYAKVFQALRIAVNREYENLEKLLHGSLENLAENGRFLVITFHSGEAGIVEEFIANNNLKSLFNNRGDKFLVPSLDELKQNLSSRSAKLYGFTKSNSLNLKSE